VEQQQPDFDVCVVGGGPAGGGLGSYLGKAGVKVVVLERDLFPRPHVGESLVPSSTRVFKDLDFMKVMEAEKFPHKFGAVWTSAAGKQEYNHGWEGLEHDVRADIRFEEREQPGVDQNYTYHVDRGRFDNLLLHHARRLGATVMTGAAVQGVDFSGQWPKVTFKMGPKTYDFTCKIVADASGRKTFLGNHLNAFSLSYSLGAAASAVDATIAASMGRNELPLAAASALWANARVLPTAPV